MQVSSHVVKLFHLYLTSIILNGLINFLLLHIGHRKVDQNEVIVILCCRAGLQRKIIEVQSIRRADYLAQLDNVLEDIINILLL